MEMQNTEIFEEVIYPEVNENVDFAHLVDLSTTDEDMHMLFTAFGF